jgi:protein TonB
MLVLDDRKQKKDVRLVCNPLDEEAGTVLNKPPQKQFLSSLIALKYERAERDHQQSKLFFAIGLTLSLIFVLMVFEWKTYDKEELLDLGTVSNDFNEIIEIPPTEQPPPPPPLKMVSPVIVEVNDEEIIKDLDLEIDVEVTEDMVIEETIFDLNTDAPVEKVDEIFDIVETQPEPVGGYSAFYKYVADNMKYPARAARLDITGRVFVQFVVEKDGSITDVKVIKGIFEDCDEEAIRVIENAPNWSPGKQRGNPVRVYQRVPIMFVLKER